LRCQTVRQAAAAPAGDEAIELPAASLRRTPPPVPFARFHLRRQKCRPPQPARSFAAVPRAADARRSPRPFPRDAPRIGMEKGAEARRMRKSTKAGGMSGRNIAAGSRVRLAHVRSILHRPASGKATVFFWLRVENQMHEWTGHHIPPPEIMLGSRRTAGEAYEEARQRL